jgi:hypothetical protein
MQPSSGNRNADLFTCYSDRVYIATWGQGRLSNYFLILPGIESRSCGSKPVPALKQQFPMFVKTFLVAKEAITDAETSDRGAARALFRVEVLLYWRLD